MVANALTRDRRDVWTGESERGKRYANQREFVRGSHAFALCRRSNRGSDVGTIGAAATSDRQPTPLPIRYGD